MSSWLWGMARPASFSRCIHPCMLRLAITCKQTQARGDLMWGGGEGVCGVALCQTNT
jgi:hypothetical protein